MSTSRIALISPYALGVFGGVQEQVLAMSRELDRRGHEVLIVAPDHADRSTCDTPATVRRFGRLLSLPANGSKAPLTLSPLASREARLAVRKFAPTIVHLHEPFAPVLGWGVLRAHAGPAVGTFHRSGAGPALELTGPLLRSLARGLDATVAVSESAAATKSIVVAMLRHPHDGPSMMASVRTVTPTVPSARPAKSTRRRSGLRDSGTT